MDTAILITGAPGSGKTTLIRGVLSKLSMPAGGFYTQEIRQAGESGMQRVREVLEAAMRSEIRAYLSLLDLGEVLYITEREQGLAQAQTVLAAIEQLPIDILEVTKDRVLAAAHVKANHRLAYTDAFAVAAAQELEGKVLTGDPGFESVEALMPVEWLEE